jgi:hypothetical protein
VHTADAKTELKPKGGVIAQHFGHLEKPLTPDVKGDLAVLDDDFLDGVAELWVRPFQIVGDFVEPSTVWSCGRWRDCHGAHQTTKT